MTGLEWKLVQLASNWSLYIIHTWGSHLQKSTQGLENQLQVVKLPSSILWGSGSTPSSHTPSGGIPLATPQTTPGPHPQTTPTGHTPHDPPLLWFSLRSILFISNTITVSRTDRERTRTMYWKQYRTFVNIYATNVSSHAARLRPSGWLEPLMWWITAHVLITFVLVCVWPWAPLKSFSPSGCFNLDPFTAMKSVPHGSKRSYLTWMRMFNWWLQSLLTGCQTAPRYPPNAPERAWLGIRTTHFTSVAFTVLAACKIKWSLGNHPLL